MSVGVGAVGEGGRGRRKGVQGYEDVGEFRGGEVLEDVHVVGETDLGGFFEAGVGNNRVRGGGSKVIPSRPGGTVAWHEGEIGVQDCGIFASLEGGKNAALERRGGGSNKVVRDVTVGGQDDVVVDFFGTGGEL